MKMKNNLKEYRIIRGLSLSELAKKSSMSKAYLSTLERSEDLSRLGLGVASRLAQVLGLSLDTIAGITPITDREECILIGVDKMTATIDEMVK